jgi:hypothetical protein
VGGPPLLSSSCHDGLAGHDVESGASGIASELAQIGEGMLDNQGKPTKLVELALAHLKTGDLAKARDLAAHLPSPEWGYGEIGRAEAKAGRAAETARWAETLTDNLHRASVLVGAGRGLLELRDSAGRQGVP